MTALSREGDIPRWTWLRSVVRAIRTGRERFPESTAQWGPPLPQVYEGGVEFSARDMDDQTDTATHERM